MIQEIKVENFRGIERLEIKGFRRVNLITGRNDCGKTALLEALFLTEAGGLTLAQGLRRLRVPIGSFDTYWRPLFRDGDADRGLSVELQQDGQPILFSARKLVETVTMANDSTGEPEVNSTWTIQQRLELRGKAHETKISGRPDGSVELPRHAILDGQKAVFGHGRPDLSNGDLIRFSKLKQSGRETTVVELLQQINSQIRSLDLLAPTGNAAALFVRIADGMPMIPLSMMGDGTQRCFEVALALATEGIEHVFLDEIENGLHHTTSETLVRFLATTSKLRNVQIFATTHSEEFIQTAARAFTELNDDGLCVLRLDRHEHDTTAALYDKSLVQATERMGIELRG